MSGWVVTICLLACAAMLVRLGAVTRQLHASRQAFEVLSQRAPMGILCADDRGLCTFANGVWCELSGLDLEQTLGHSWSQAVHPEDLPRVMERWEQSVHRQEPYVNEVRLLRPDGSERLVLAGACPMHDDQGRVSGFIGTVLDVTGLDQARRDLGERERLLRSLIEVQETEKQLLCHEFHDGLIQYAVGSKMLLEGLLAGPAAADPREVVDSVIQCLARGIADGRRVIRGIRPAALDDLGLQAALEELADDLRESAVVVEADFAGAIDEIPQPIQTAVYRVVQESLSNVRKHSGSRSARIALRRTDERIELEVSDGGCGFDAAVTASRGFGLLGIRERVRLVGGECRIESGSGAGTRVRVAIPLPPAESVRA